MKGVFVLIVISAQLAFGANPNYSYHVKIDDPAQANFQEKAEARKGEYAEGFYSVLDPNGALRTVSYVADEWGFNPQVSYSYPGAAFHSSVGVLKPGHPATVTDQRLQIVQKTGVAPAFPQAVAVAAPVKIAAPVRVVAQAAPIRLTAAPSVPVIQNYAPAYLPPPPAPVLVQKQIQAPIAVAQPVKTLAFPPPPQVLLSKPVSVPTIAVAQDSYAVAPINTVTDPNAQVYPDAVKVVQKPLRYYGHPAYLPPPVLTEVTQVKKVVAVAPPRVRVVAQLPPPQPIAVAKLAVAALAVKYVSPYANAIGYSTYSGSADAYGLSYGTPGFQVTSSRKFNKGLIAVAPVQKQIIAAPQVAIAPQVQYAAPIVKQAPVVQYAQYAAPPPAPVAVAAAPVSAPVVQYAAPPPQVVRYAAPPPPQVVQYAAPPPPAPVVQYAAPQVQYAAPQVQYAAPQVQYAAAAPAIAVKQVSTKLAPALVGPAPVAFSGGKQNPLTFSYGYKQGAATVSHSYAGSGW